MDKNGAILDNKWIILDQEQTKINHKCSNIGSKGTKNKSKMDKNEPILDQKWTK